MRTRDPLFTGAAFQASAGQTFNVANMMMMLMMMMMMMMMMMILLIIFSSCKYAMGDDIAKDLVFSSEFQQVFRANLHREKEGIIVILLNSESLEAMKFNKRRRKNLILPPPVKA